MKSRGQRSEKTLGDALASYLAKSGLTRATGVQPLQKIWQEAVGSEAAQHTRATSLRGGVLRVEVDSAAWLYELSNSCQEELLEKLRAQMPGRRVLEVKFRLGSQRES